MMTANFKKLPDITLSQRLAKTLDDLGRVTATLPDDEDLVDFLIEAGEIGNGPKISGPKDV